MIEPTDIALSQWTPDQNPYLTHLDTSTVSFSGIPYFPQRSYDLNINTGVENQFSVMVGGKRPITIEVKHTRYGPTLKTIALGHGCAGFIVKILIRNNCIKNYYLWYVATGPGQQKAELHQTFTVSDWCSIL